MTKFSTVDEIIKYLSKSDKPNLSNHYIKCSYVVNFHPAELLEIVKHNIPSEYDLTIIQFISNDLEYIVDLKRKVIYKSILTVYKNRKV